MRPFGAIDTIDSEDRGNFSIVKRITNQSEGKIVRWMGAADFREKLFRALEFRTSVQIVGAANKFHKCRDAVRGSFFFEQILAQG